MISMSARFAADGGDGGEAVHHGHDEVHQDDIRLQLAGHVDGLLAVGGLPNDLQVLVVFEEHAESLAHDFMVIGKQDADGHVDSGRARLVMAVIIGERGTGNGERGNGERGTGNGERGTGRSCTLTAPTAISDGRVSSPGWGRGGHLKGHP